MTEKAVLNKYQKLPLKKKVEVLWDALDYMQQYNGRTKKDCIIFAMGHTPIDYADSDLEI